MIVDEVLTYCNLKGILGSFFVLQTPEKNELLFWFIWESEPGVGFSNPMQNWINGFKLV
jgi:hypothetical protein